MSDNDFAYLAVVSMAAILLGLLLGVVTRGGDDDDG